MMNRIYTGFLLIVAFALALGCGGGGSSPTNAVTGPHVVSLNPTTGGPGTVVQIQGSGFGSVQGGSILSFSGVTVIPNSWSDTVITATIPANATSDGSFVITVNGRVSNPTAMFTLGNPTIYSISPTQGNPGTLVTIYGNNFGAQTNESRITFNGQTATINTWLTNQVTCTVPTTLSVSGDVSVVVYANLSRPSNAAQFTVTIPTITSITPATDNIGASITISGTGFGASQGQSFVTIGGNQATVVFWAETFIQARIPTGAFAGANNVIVTVNGRASTPSSVTVSAPVITSQSATASKNNPLTLNGSHLGTTQLEGNGTVQVQGAGLVSPTFWSDTTITFTWPINNDPFGTQLVPVTVTVGGLSTTVTVTAD